MTQRPREPLILFSLGTVLLVWSGIRPHDRFTWFLEVAPIGTQGDVWDTQWDMFLCLLGSLAAQITLSRLHDRQIAALIP